MVEPSNSEVTKWKNVVLYTNSTNKKKDIDKPQASTNVVELSNSEVTKWKNIVPDTNSSNKEKDIDEPQTGTNLVQASNTEVPKWKNVVAENKESSEETVLKKCSDQKCSDHNSTIDFNVKGTEETNNL